MKFEVRAEEIAVSIRYIKTQLANNKIIVEQKLEPFTLMILPQSA